MPFKRSLAPPTGVSNSVYTWRGGVGTAEGKLSDAAFSRATEGSREDTREIEGVVSGEAVVLGGCEGGCEWGREWRPSRWIASLEAFSRMYAHSEAVRPGRVSEMSMRRTLVGEPCWVLLRLS